MLNNLTNFFNLVKTRFVKTTAEPDDVLILGVPDKSYTGGYKPAMIQYKNLVTDTVVASGTGIFVTETTGINGEKIYTVNSAGGSTINYSNVIFVDALQGNDGTAVVGRFDKPYQYVWSAMSMANSLPKSSSDKVLVYFRKGQYYWSGYLSNYADVYCEPGVVFTGGRIQDGYGAVNSNFFGYAILQNADFYVSNGSTINFEFDYISNNQSAGLIIPASGTANVTIKANNIYASGIGTAYVFTIRNNANVFVDVKRSIQGPHQNFAFRNYTGNCVINCPRIEMSSGNIYGGNYKHAFIFYDGMSGNITVNGDIINTDPVYYGGTSAMITPWGWMSGKFILNGNISSTVTRPINGSIGGGGSMEINGNIYSDSLGIWCYGNGKFLFKNGIIKGSITHTDGYLLASNGTAEVFIKDCYLYNAVIDSSLIVINGLTTPVVIDGCSGVSEGALGYSINTSVAGGLLYINNSRMLKGLNPALVDGYVPSGLIVDVNTKVPKF